MKRYIIILGLAALACVSCQKTFDYQIKQKLDTPATLRLTFQDIDEPVVLMAPKTKSYTINLTAPSIADEMLSVTIAANPSKVAAYNKSHGTNYSIVPAEAYEFSSTSFILPRYNTTGTTSQLTLKSSGMPEDDETHVLPISITKIEGTDKVSMSPEDSTVYVLFRRKLLPPSGFEEGTGTQADPYLIHNPTEMFCISKALKSGQKIYFKLAADVDMTGEDWIPVNSVSPFDLAVDFNGNGHTITGLTSNADVYPSFFGVLVGSVYDVTFVNPRIDVGSSVAGFLAGVAGTAAEGATVKNVTVKGLTVNCSGKTTGLGGLVGSAIGSAFTNVSVDVKFVDADGDGTMPSAVGGFVGQCLTAASTFTGCKTSGTVYGAASTAGFCGYIESVAGVKFENCSTSCTVTTTSQRCGGFLGYGKAFDITLIGCASSGDVTTNGHYTGGLIGVFNGASTIKKCFSTGNVYAKGGNHIGGLIGNCGADSANEVGSLIEDCYATGDVTLSASSGRMGGGLVGVCEKAKNVTIRRCYASGNVTSPTQQVGGIISFAKSATLTENMGFTCEKCIAWNKKLTASNPAAANWASGAIAGTSNTVNTITDCYRRPDMVLVDTDNGSRDYKLFDCDNISPSSPMTWFNATNNYYPHHGKAAPAGSTVSSVAQTLGWPSDVWDLSSEFPKLK